MLKALVLSVAAVALVSAPLVGGSNGPVVDDYVEARTAEVFVGACQLGIEGESAGRQAVMAWRVAQGSYSGIPLDGLSIVAAVAANTNLGWWELRGRKPAVVKAAVMIDERANRNRVVSSLACRARRAVLAYVVRTTRYEFYGEPKTTRQAAGKGNPDDDPGFSCRRIDRRSPGEDCGDSAGSQTAAISRLSEGAPRLLGAAVVHSSHRPISRRHRRATHRAHA